MLKSAFLCLFSRFKDCKAELTMPVPECVNTGHAGLNIYWNKSDMQVMFEDMKIVDYKRNSLWTRQLKT